MEKKNESPPTRWAPTKLASYKWKVKTAISRIISPQIYPFIFRPFIRMMKPHPIEKTGSGAHLAG